MERASQCARHPGSLISPDDSKEPTVYKKILVTLDGSALAECVLPHAVILARATGSEVTLATVLTPETCLAVAGPMLEHVPEAMAERKEALKGEARLYLERIAHAFLTQGIVTHSAVLEGDVAHQIVACAEEEEFDLIAMATHGRSGIDRFIMGSVAERVLRGTFKPVLLIRASAAGPQQVDRQREAPPP